MPAGSGSFVIPHLPEDTSNRFVTESLTPEHDETAPTNRGASDFANVMHRFPILYECEFGRPAGASAPAIQIASAPSSALLLIPLFVLAPAPLAPVLPLFLPSVR